MNCFTCTLFSFPTFPFAVSFLFPLLSSYLPSPPPSFLSFHFFPTSIPLLLPYSFQPLLSCHPPSLFSCPLSPPPYLFPTLPIISFHSSSLLPTPTLIPLPLHPLSNRNLSECKSSTCKWKRKRHGLERKNPWPPPPTMAKTGSVLYSCSRNTKHWRLRYKVSRG